MEKTYIGYFFLQLNKIFLKLWFSISCPKISMQLKIFLIIEYSEINPSGENDMNPPPPDFFINLPPSTSQGNNTA